MVAYRYPNIVFANSIKRDLFGKYQMYFRVEMNEEPLVETAAKIFQELVYSYRSTLTAGIIVAGWDRRKGGQVNLTCRRAFQ